MDEAPGAGTFRASGAAYDSFMGRYSRPLAASFVQSAGLASGGRVLDVGCGPGALTAELVRRFGAGSVSAFDPSEPFARDCAADHPGVEVRIGRAEAIPFGSASFDAALAQLVVHFVSDPEAAAAELRRVVRPGGTVAACVWDFERGMEMLRHFWDAALTVDPGAPDEATSMRFGRRAEIAELFAGAGFEDVAETTLTVTVAYTGFDQLWAGFLAGVGPAGSYCVALDGERQTAVRDELFRRVGSPAGAFALDATARSARARVPG